jgi:hypothetical protein
MPGTPLWVAVVLGLIAGLSVIISHAVGGWAIVHQGFGMVNRPTSYRVTMRTLAGVLLTAGTLVGIYVCYSLVVGAIGADVIGECR